LKCKEYVNSLEPDSAVTLRRDHAQTQLKYPILTLVLLLLHYNIVCLWNMDCFTGREKIIVENEVPDVGQVPSSTS